MKDKLLLLFWGLVCGALFVGAILYFGGIINWLGAHQLGVGPVLFKAGLGIVIVGAIWVIGKTAGKVLAKVHIKQVSRILPPGCVAAALQTPLGRAVLEQREDIIDQLRFLPLSTRQRALNSPVYKGMTALHIAAAMGNTKFCKYLLKYGADAHKTDQSGRTPADWARSHGYESTACFLDKNAGKSASKVIK